MDKLGIRVFLVFVLLSFGFLLLDSWGNLMFFRNASSYVVAPFSFASSNVRSNASETFSFLRFWRSGEERIKNLEQRNLELQVKAGRTDVLERENKLLRQQLGVTSLAEKKLLPSRVLGGDRLLVIGSGSNDGVRQNQTVVFKDALVGKVVRVTDNLAYVQLPTDVDSKTPVQVEADLPVRGLLVGQFNSSLILDQIVQTEKISKEQSISTTGEDERFEPGLLVGKIEKIISKETDLFKRAEVKPAVDPRKLETVFVILN